MNPKVSVIVPNYNHAPYLRERIESILNQSYSNFELILLDDLSSDNSREVLESYSTQPKVKDIVFNTINSGSTFKQWKKGIERATGKYIWIAESDDVADKDFLKCMMDSFQSYPEAKIAFSNSYLIDQDSKRMKLDLDRQLDSERSNGKASLWDGKRFINDKMLEENRIYNASSVVFEKTLWVNIDKGFTGYKLCGDWICWVEMVLESKSIIHIPLKLNYFRQHTNKVTTKSVKNGLAVIERRKVQDFIERNMGLSPFQKLWMKGKCLILTNRIQDEEVKDQISRTLEFNTWLSPLYFISYSLHVFLRRYICSR